MPIQNRLNTLLREPVYTLIDCKLLTSSGKRLLQHWRRVPLFEVPKLTLQERMKCSSLCVRYLITLPEERSLGTSRYKRVTPTLRQRLCLRAGRAATQQLCNEGARGVHSHARQLLSILQLHFNGQSLQH
jgi:hypothetical protein